MFIGDRFQAAALGRPTSIREEVKWFVSLLRGERKC